MYRTPWFNVAMFTVHAVQSIVIAPVFFVCVFVCVWVCYHDDSKLRPSILTELVGCSYVYTARLLRCGVLQLVLSFLCVCVCVCVCVFVGLWLCVWGGGHFLFIANIYTHWFGSMQALCGLRKTRSIFWPDVI